MIQAAAVRGLDFSETHPFDRWWWLKVSLITDQLERQSMSRIYEARHAAQCASLQISEKPMEAWDAIVALTNKLTWSLMPWAKIETKDDQRRQLAEGWKSTWGDPDDPQVAEKIRQTAMALIRDANVAIRKAQRE